MTEKNIYNQPIHFPS